MTDVSKSMSKENAKITADGKEIELPVIVGSEQEKAIDISKLRAQTGLVTIDNGFVNTASCESSITFLNGEEGILKYRGYPIEELAEKSNFIEVAYLLIYGELPNSEQLDSFQKRIHEQSETKDELKKMIAGFPKSSHPMGVLSSVMAAMSAYYPENLDTDLSDEKKTS